MWIKREDFEKIQEENKTLKVKVHELETSPKAWSDAEMSTDLIEHIARVNNLHLTGSIDNSFFLLQRIAEESKPGDGAVW